MKLVELIKHLGCYRPASLLDGTVKGIRCRSTEVLPGFIFVAVKGERADGHDFLDEAVAKGAVCIIVQEGHALRKISEKVSVISVSDTRKAAAILCDAFYYSPSSRMRLVGVTGTNGKTTITYLIEALLARAGRIGGVIGTVNYRYAGVVVPALNTTPGPCELHSLLYDMAEKGVSDVVMEVSSHALEQERVMGIKFSSAVFTNLTQDHLDYHGDLERYFRAKAKLFEGLEPGACAVVNADCPYGRKLRSMTKASVVTYGIKEKAEVTASDIELSLESTRFTLKAGKNRLAVATGLVGRHNVYNLLATAAWCLSAELDVSLLGMVAEHPPVVPGRLERIETKQRITVFVDYAHTEDALRNVMTSLRQVASSRLIVVFGCGGDRDKGKRPLMGKVVSELGDVAVVTTDNPRSEDPEAIIAAITAGMVKKNYEVVVDRRQAIASALAMAKKGDCVLIAGKGHERTQVFKDKVVSFDDREVVRECLRSQQ